MELLNAKINFLGDSITQGCGTSNDSFRFTDILRDKYGVDARNYGIGGTRVARQKYPSENPIIDQDFCLRYKDMNPDADAIVIFGGSNDFGHGDSLIGELSDTDPLSFCGACNTLFDGIKKMYPGAKILIVTPLHRTNESDPNGDGISAVLPRPLLKEFAKAIKDVAAIHGLPVLDFFSDESLNPNTPVLNTALYVDGLHPNDAGHAILAEKLADALRAL